MSEQVAKQVIVFIFKRGGKNKISESEFYLTLSMELQWCPPNLAKSFVSECLKAGLVHMENESIIPSFDIDHIKIPIDFQPSVDFFKEFKVEVNQVIRFDSNSFIDSLQNLLDLSTDEINKSVDNFVQNKHITRDVALLLFAKKHGMDVIEHSMLIETLFFKENKV